MGCVFVKRRFSIYPHKWILFYVRDDWLARRWLAKYNSPPLWWIIVKYTKVIPSEKNFTIFLKQWSQCPFFSLRIMDGHCGNYRFLKEIIIRNPSNHKHRQIEEMSSTIWGAEHFLGTGGAWGASVERKGRGDVKTNVFSLVPLATTR